MGHIFYFSFQNSTKAIQYLEKKFTENLSFKNHKLTKLDLSKRYL